MDKRYQVFVSSTFADLKEERSKVIQTLMEMDCIPAGMELFPTMDDEQFEFIKKVIDDCDYYILIIQARYGSVDSEGISYTEKEFDYAVEKGMKVLVFIHESPDDIAVNKTDKDTNASSKLEAFKEKACTDRLVKKWKNPDDLPGLVAVSLLHTIKRYEAIGWVRADKVSNESLIIENQQLKEENQKLKAGKSSPFIDIGNSSLASLDEEYTIFFSESGSPYGEEYIKYSLTWLKLFMIVGKCILGGAYSKDLAKSLSNYFSDDFHLSVDIDMDCLLTISIQFEAHGLVVIDRINEKWNLTDEGKKLFYKERVVKSDKD